MINHLRTLLLNIDGSNNPGEDYPGEQYVPEDFVSRSMNIQLKTIHRFLFGINPDRAMLNLRLQEYLTCIHASGLESFVTAFDPRITYFPFKRSLFSWFARGIRAKQLAAMDQSIYLLGDLNVIQSVNRLYRQWEVSVIDGSTVRLTECSPDSKTTTTTTASYSITDGLSSAIQLGDSSVSFKFDEGVGNRWLIDVLAKPARSICQVVDDLDTGLTTSLNNLLFDGLPELKTIWTQSDRLPERIASVVLALGYKLNEV